MIEETGLLLAEMPPARNQQHGTSLFAIGSSPALHLGFDGRGSLTLWIADHRA